MSGTRPRAPWYSPATRRLAVLRVGLPTLVACLLATGPGATVQAERAVPPSAAALVTRVTAMLKPPPPPADVQAVPADAPGRDAGRGRGDGGGPDGR